MEIEDLLKQSILEDDPIENIFSSLASYFEVGISPVICANLIIPILEHAIRNPHLAKSVTTYGNVISSMYHYTFNEDLINTQIVFEETAKTIKLISQQLRGSFIVDTYELDVKSIDSHILTHVLAVTTLACSIMLMEHVDFYFNTYLSIVWDELPQLLKIGGKEHNPTSFIILESTINISKIIIERDLEDYDDLTVCTLLTNILKTVSKPDIPEELKVTLAEAIIFLIESCPHIQFSNAYQIVDYLDAYASTELSNNINPTLLKSIFLLCYLLAKNGVKTNWFSNDLLQKYKNLNSVEATTINLLVEKYDDVVNSLTLHSRSQSAMDIDEPSYENISRKVSEIVYELTGSDERSEHNQQLLLQLKYMSTLKDNEDLLILCQPHMKKITEFVTRILVSDPEFAENVTQLLGFQIPDFLSCFLEYALPYALVRVDNDDALSCIATSLGFTINQLCRNGASHIFVYLFMESDTRLKAHGFKRLKQIIKTMDTGQELVKENVTKITTALAMYLGIPHLKESALNGLMELKDSTSAVEISISTHISTYFIAILERISRFISEKRDHLEIIQDPQALIALGEIMLLLKSDIKDHTIHLMKLFETVNKLPGMQLEALQLWKIFISLLEEDELRGLLYPITKSLIDILTISDYETRKSAVMVLEDVLIRKSFITFEDYAKIPALPDYEELSRINTYIDSKRKKSHESVRLKTEIPQIMADFSDFDDLNVLLGLQKLEKILSDEQDFHDFRNELYSKLLYLIGKYSSNQHISYLAAVCLGKLGAVDPSLVQMKTIDDTVFIMNNFSRQDENLVFVRDMIINHIYPAYNSVSEVQARLCIEYSIQTLLREAGYQPIDEMKSKGSLLAVYTSWRKLPLSIQEFLTPFLQSAYQVSLSEQPLEYPIYTKAKNFQEWVKHWFCRMANSAKSPAKDIFVGCIPMVHSNLTDITLHLLPYVVLHVILDGVTNDVRDIVGELKLVLTTNAKPDNHSRGGQMNEYALQVAVSITDYCRKWLNHVGARDPEKSSLVSRVQTFLQCIPNVTMGLAAFHTKAYPQALMQFETHIKEQEDLERRRYKNELLKSAGNELTEQRDPVDYSIVQKVMKKLDPKILKYLRQIYIQLDDPVSLKMLMNTYTSVLSLEEEVFRYESLGKWDEAEVLYRKKIHDSPFDFSSYEGYMECLKKSGNYESLLYIADKEFANIPKLQPQINSFKIDSAWHLKDWETLDKSVNLPMQRNFQSLVGCALDHMLRERHMESSCIIEEARFDIIQQIKMSSYQSYRRYYPSLFNLQLLQELEDSQLLWESDNPATLLKKSEAAWRSNRKLIRPRSQYQIRLLELRKAAFYDIRNTDRVRVNESELWLRIAKENRKLGKMAVSLNALHQAERMGGKSLHLEKAKWFWKNGYSVDAIRLVKSKNGSIETTNPYDALFLTSVFVKDSESSVHTHQYHKVSLRVGPEKIEKAYHNFVGFFVKFYPVHRYSKPKAIRILSEILTFSASALRHGSRYYYSSMSRLINTWLDITNYDVSDVLSTQTEEAMKIKQCLANAKRVMDSIATTVPLYLFSLFLTRLISQLATPNEHIANCLIEIISQVFMAYPRNTIWLMMSSLESGSVNVSRRMNTILQIAQQQKSDTQIPVIIQQAAGLKRELFELSQNEDKSTPNINIATHPKYKRLLGIKDLDLYIPKEGNMLPILPEVIIPDDRPIKPFPDDSPTIKCLGPQIVVMKSLQAPKKIGFYGSDGRLYPFLLKSKDDLRKDARTMEFNYMINHFLKKNPDSRDCELYIRTYFVIPMGDRWGLIEWIDNLNPLKSIVNGYWEAAGISSVNSMSAQLSKASLSLPGEKKKFFEEKILPRCPSVFYKWFLKNFPESNQWLNSRARYIKTLAVMSIVGYLIGLGDRHAENILFDTTNGDCVHVDLNMLFGFGTKLPVPEIVPFRLTQNLVGAMGIFGAKGLFQNICEVTLEVLRANKEPLLSVFQTYVNELEASHRPSLRSTQANASETIINPIEARFDIETKVSIKVEKLIKVASANENLAQMFPGWCPFV